MTFLIVKKVETLTNLQTTIWRGWFSDMLTFEPIWHTFSTVFLPLGENSMIDTAILSYYQYSTAHCYTVIPLPVEVAGSVKMKLWFYPREKHSSKITKHDFWTSERKFMKMYARSASVINIWTSVALCTQRNLWNM